MNNTLKRKMNILAHTLTIWRRYINIKMFSFGLTLIPLVTNAGDWTLYLSNHDDAALCERLNGRLNSFEWRNENCSWNVLMSDDGFISPPWKTLDPGQNKALLVKLLRYWEEGADGYFHRLRDRSKTRHHEFYLKMADKFIADGGKMEVWRTHLLRRQGDGTPIGPARQTVVQLDIPRSIAKHAKLCRQKPHIDHERVVILTTTNLKGPDPSVKSGTAYVLLTSTLLLYMGKPYFVDPYSVWSDHDGRLQYACVFHYIDLKKYPGVGQENNQPGARRTPQ